MQILIRHFEGVYLINFPMRKLLLIFRLEYVVCRFYTSNVPKTISHVHPPRIRFNTHHIAIKERKDIFIIKTRIKEQEKSMKEQRVPHVELPPHSYVDYLRILLSNRSLFSITLRFIEWNIFSKIHLDRKRDSLFIRYKTK